MSFQIDVAGHGALAALAELDHGGGVVRAVFQRSCYLECAQGRHICVGDVSIGRGPINALMRHFVAPERGQRVGVSLKHARLWQQPKLNVLPWTTEVVAHLTWAAQGRIPQDGLGGLITGATSPLIARARPALDALAVWLASRQKSTSQAQGLIGLGPGLTPSGDDYLVGLLIGLRGMGHPVLADRLWAWLEPLLATATNAISASHLQAAATGEGHEVLHDCIHAVSQGQALEAALAALACVGHCSGWDALAGVVAAAQIVQGRAAQGNLDNAVH